ncbi:hypothetical protein AUC43_15300 [Hymenobacter sedentarius]|uniref:Phage gp6-like head-tail connector protein n=1 Tax=Hymenobacter sedentarius TaxID=1411621 RepID=A0A0U4CDV4_9BACT|nr:head-tail connector protein [Hymenobacter sedentarius]ALW86329.1 hypothetical protein AUC43_15300 [Hymenobacter sedentarius]
MEPVTLAFFKTYARLSNDIEDAVLELFIAAAREKAEAYCNRHFVSKVAEKTFPVNVSSTIPAEDILSVTGYYTSAEQVAQAYWYWVEYQKGIIVNRDYPIDYDNLPTYTVRYQVTIDPSDVPASVKVAIAKIAADLYENREHSTSIGNQELSIGFKSLLAPYKIINS